MRCGGFEWFSFGCEFFFFAPCALWSPLFRRPAALRPFASSSSSPSSIGFLSKRFRCLLNARKTANCRLRSRAPTSVARARAHARQVVDIAAMLSSCLIALSRGPLLRLQRAPGEEFLAILGRDGFSIAISNV